METVCPPKSMNNSPVKLGVDKRNLIEKERTSGRYEGGIKEYIRNQLQEDIVQDSLNFKEYTDPLTGGYYFLITIHKEK